MGKQAKSAPAPEPSDLAKLAAVVESLTHQVRSLASILDEVREDLVWAVRNDKFTCVNHSQQYVANAMGNGTQPEMLDDDDEEEEEPPPPSVSNPVKGAETSLFE